MQRSILDVNKTDLFHLAGSQTNVAMLGLDVT